MCRANRGGSLLDDGRNASFTFDGVSRRARLVDLPTILETHKTFDNKQLYKIADISQMLIVDDAPPLPLAPPTLSGPRPKANDEEFQHPHGITPPLKYVRKRRFRKRAKWMVEDVEREVQRLLLADERSDQTRICTHLYLYFLRTYLDVKRSSAAMRTRISLTMSK